MGSVSTVDADMSHPSDGCAHILDQPRQPDRISVPTMPLLDGMSLGAAPAGEASREMRALVGSTGVG